MKCSVKPIILILLAILLSISCQNLQQQNNAKIVGLTDPKVDSTVKAALENGTVSEVVVRKDLLLFPVNAPDLVIAHRQEVHALPRNDSTDADGKPSAAEVAEVNEYTLSQLISTNDSAIGNENQGDTVSVPVNTLSSQSNSTNDSIIEPSKLLEIASGFNLSNGLSTEKVSLPDQIQNMNIPKESIVDLLSKSLTQSNGSLTTFNSPNVVGKRSVDYSYFNNTESQVNDDDSTGSNIVKRSGDAKKNEDKSQDTNIESSATSIKPTATNVDNSNDPINVRKRFSNEDSDNFSRNNSNSTELKSIESFGIKLKKRSIDSEENVNESDDLKADSKSIEEVNIFSTNSSMSSSEENASKSEDSDTNNSRKDKKDSNIRSLYIMKRSIINENESSQENDSKSNFSSNVSISKRSIEDEMSLEENDINDQEINRNIQEDKKNIKKSIDSYEDDSSVTMEDYNEED